jgi:hypothetical protein
MQSDFHQRKSHFDGNDLGNVLPTTEEVSIFVKQNFAVKGVLSADDAKSASEAKKIFKC